MNKEKRAFIIRSVIAFLYSAIFPVMLKFLLRSTFSLAIILPLVLLKTLFAFFCFHENEKVARVFNIISSVYSILFAVLVVTGILITPSYSYVQLFALINSAQVVSARVSIIFVLFVGFFSSTFSLSVLKKEYVWAFLGIGLVASVMASLFFLNTVTIAVAVVFILGTVVYLAVKHLDMRYRAAGILFSLLIVLISGGGGYYIYNKVQPRGNKAVDDLSNSLREGLSNIFPNLPIMMEMPEYGFSMDSEDQTLGLAPVLSPVQIFEVEATRGGMPVYLKTRVFNFFDNDKWQTLLPESEVPDEEIVKHFNLGELALEENDLRVTLLLEYYHRIPYTLATSRFQTNSIVKNFEWGDFSIGFSLSEQNPIRMGSTFILKQHGYPEPFGENESLKYLQLPFFLSEEVKTLSKKYKVSKDPEEVLKAIRKDFAENYLYNLEAKVPEEGKPFLDYFLFTSKSGFSVHFASATTILARMNGIPARYVTGFLVNIPSPPEEGSAHGFEGFKTRITGLSAHSWVEYYTKGKGWRIFEATPALEPSFYGVDSIEQIDLVLNSATRRQLNSLLGRDPFASEKQQDIKKFTFNYYILLIIPIGFLIFWLISTNYINFLYLFRKDKKTFIYLSKRIIMAQKKNGIPSPEKTGWLQWADNLKQKIPSSGMHVDIFVESMLQIAYGGLAVERGDVINVFLFYKKVGGKKIKNKS